MKVILIDKFYGYCPGLKRSLKIAFDLAKKAKKDGKSIYCDVPLAHNHEVMASLAKEGIELVDNIEDVKPHADYFLISAHGASDKRSSLITELGFAVENATCPTVLRVQKQAKEDSTNGYQIIIFGKAGHPEVEGVHGCVGGKVIITKDPDDGKKIRLTQKTSVICQTTISEDKFFEFCANLAEQNPGVEIIRRNTVCPVVKSRIANIRNFIIENKPDLAIVVGSPTSSNTRQLKEKIGSIVETIMIEDERDLDLKIFEKVESVVIVSGTSAPPELVERVALKLEQ